MKDELPVSLLMSGIPNAAALSRTVTVIDAIPNATSNAARQLAAQIGATLEDVLLAAYSVLFCRTVDRPGFTVAVRSDTTGTLALLPVPVERDRPPDFECLTRGLAAGRRSLVGRVPEPADGVLTVGFAVTGTIRQDETDQHPIGDVDLIVAPGNSGPTPFAIRQLADELDPDCAARMAARFATVLAHAVRDAGAAISDLEVLPAAERRLVVSDWNTAESAADADRTIVDGFNRQAMMTPDRLAVTDEDGAELSYGQLWRASNALAHRLLRAGVGPEHRCAVVVDRTVAMPVAILAVLKAGGAYLPADLETPFQRLALMFSDARVAVVITESRLRHLIPPGPWHVVEIDDGGRPRRRDHALETGPADDPGVTISPGQLAYVMYTSGSTGQPKGVLIEHGCVTAFAAGCRRSYQLTAEDRYLQYSSLAFDVSTFDLFCALLTGASVHVASTETRRSLHRARRLLRDRGITVYMGTPALPKLLVPAEFPGLRLLAIGGEPYPGELVARWAAGRQFFNSYGPTETTVGVIIRECGPRDTDASPPIGRAMPGHRCYVLDDRMRPVPIGTPGHLYVGGPGVGRGYLGKPGLTASSFVPDPLSGQVGARLYRTGDLAKWRADGQLIFIGRSDNQVKVRGMRVEPGEVAAVLAADPEVEQAVVCAEPDPVSGARLIAYVLPARPSAFNVGRLRSWACSRLPPFMVPGEFVSVSAIPLTSSGKIDESALRAGRTPGGDASAGRGDATQTASAPAFSTDAATPAERLLIDQVLLPILGEEPVAVDQNLFEIGVTSLHIIQVLDRVLDEYGVEVPVEEFFESPTISGLARAIDTAQCAELRASVADSHDAIADELHRFRCSLADPTPAAWLEPLRLGSSADVLEVGAAGSPLDARVVGQHRVTALDASARLLEKTAERLPSATLAHSDLLTAEFPEAAFDWVLARDVLSHLPRQQLVTALRRIRRWLRPGGTFVGRLACSDEPGAVSQWFGEPVYWSAFDAARLKEAFADAGLELIAEQAGMWPTPAGPLPAIWLLGRAATHHADGKEHG